MKTKITLVVNGLEKRDFEVSGSILEFAQKVKKRNLSLRAVARMTRIEFSKIIKVLEKNIYFNPSEYEVLTAHQL